MSVIFLCLNISLSNRNKSPIVFIRICCIGRIFFCRISRLSCAYSFAVTKGLITTLLSQDGGSHVLMDYSYGLSRYRNCETIYTDGKSFPASRRSNDWWPICAHQRNLEYVSMLVVLISRSSKFLCSTTKYRANAHRVIIQWVALSVAYHVLFQSVSSWGQFANSLWDF